MGDTNFASINNYFHYVSVDVEYDEALADITRCEEALVEHLRDMKRKTGLNDLKYWGSNKDRYQIEVEIGKASAVPSSWMARSQKKTHRRSAYMIKTS